MTRTLAALLLLSALLPARASASAQTMLNAEVWYLQYDVTLTGAGHEENKADGRNFVADGSFEQVLTGVVKLDMRTPGASLSMTELGMSGLPAADLQKKSMDLVMKTDQMATWMAGDPMAQLEPTAKARTRYQYHTVDRYPPSPDEAELLEVKTTGVGEANVVVMAQVMLELDTTTNEYRVGIPHGFDDRSSDSMKMETTTITGDEGKNLSETQSETRGQNNLVQEIQVGGNPLGAPITRGKFDPATGKISGTQSFDVTFKVINLPMTGKMVMKYTLTQTPPVAAAAARP